MISELNGGFGLELFPIDIVVINLILFFLKAVSPLFKAFLMNPRRCFMLGSMKKSKIFSLGILVSCILCITIALVYAHEKHGDPNKQARKAALNAFFDKQLCNDCHGPNPVYNIRSARAGYDVSGHKKNGHAFYSNGEDCQRCHTHEGFVQYVTTGKIDEKSIIEMPTQPACFTCHDPHATGDLSLRTAKPVTLPSGKNFDMGSGNICAQCHTTRGKASDVVKDLPADKISAVWGAHHGPQADMLIGSNAYEYAGKKYSNSAHATVIQNSCAECHMAFPEKRYGLSPELGGHSFSIEGDVNHQPKLNAAGCLSNCHSKVGQVKAKNPDTPADTFWWHPSELIFDIEAKADFDNDGKVEPLQAEIEGLLNLFVNNKGTGYLQKGELPMYKPDGSWNSTKSQVLRPLKEVAALYNYKYVLEDRSRGIHNAAYTIQILYDSIESLDPKFDTSKRNVY